MATYNANSSFIDTSLVKALNEAFGFITKVQQVNSYMQFFEFINKVQQVNSYRQFRELQDISHNFYDTLGGE